MKDVMTGPATVEGGLGSEETRPISSLLDVAARLFNVNADRWRRRAEFYERHRDYFPRLASGSFVDRCHQLESASRAIARTLFAMPSRGELVPVRVTVPRLE